MHTKIDRPFLYGKKVYLRPLDLDDVNQKYLSWMNDEEIIDQLDTVFPTALFQLENYVESVLKNPKYSFFAIVERETNAHIGNVKLGPIHWINRTSNYGLFIGEKDKWGKGYASEAFALLLKFAFEKINLNKIWDMAAATNIASIKSNQKAGFKIEGTLKEQAFKKGKYEDAVILSITAKEYFNLIDAAEK